MTRKHVAALAIAMVTGCAAPPPATSRGEQDLCQIDPETGLCPSDIDAAQQATEAYADQYEGERISAGCRDSGGWVDCWISIDVVYCTVIVECSYYRGRTVCSASCI